MSQSVITRHDIEHFTFREYRKHGTTKLSNETLEVGQRVQTLEGEYACGELSRLAIDAKGNVYPVAESVFAVSYEPAGADPAAEIARLRAEVERLEREVAERADEAESDHRGILRLGGEIDCLKADNKILRADVERKDEALKLTERTLAFIPDESIPRDMHAAVGLLKRKITAALADTANKQGEQTCDH